MNQLGYFLELMVLMGVVLDMIIVSDEVFGLVLFVLKVWNENEVLVIVNGMFYGLVVGVFIVNVDWVMWVFCQFRVGQVFVNEWYVGGVEILFGGFGKFGYGWEKGCEVLFNYVQIKNIVIRIG